MIFFSKLNRRNTEIRRCESLSAVCTKHGGVTVDALQIDQTLGADALYKALVTASAQSRYILVKGYFHSIMIQQVVQWFLERNKYLLERAETEVLDGAGNLLISLTHSTAGPEWTGYAALENSYSKAYYLQDCGGYEIFLKSKGKRADPRLMDIYQLVHPKKGERILDIGCGRGELSYALAQSGADVTGVDYSKDAIQIALETYQSRPEKLHYLQADIFQMTNLGTYDKLVMADVVEHIEQPVLERIFCKLKNSLSKTGLLAIHTSPNLDYYQVTYPKRRKMAAECGCYLPEDPRSFYEKKMHINEQTPASLQIVLEKQFPFVHVWTGRVFDIAEEKSREQSCEDTDIFAVACQDENTLRLCMKLCEAVFAEAPVFERCHVTFSAEDICLPAGQIHTVAEVSIANHGEQVLSSERKYPICLTYRLCDLSGNVVFDGGNWAMINDCISNGEQKTVTMPISVPPTLERGRDYLVRVTLVADQCFWFDQTGENWGQFLLHLE